MIHATRCPCCSGKPYKDCCLPYIEGQTIPATAEALMRSRYTAYTQANVDYIQATMCGPAAKDYNSEQARIWAKTAKWRRLKVLQSFAHPSSADIAYVHFIAYYVFQGKPQKLEETSEFHCINGQWFYVSNSNS